uniref:Cytochrome P450 306a1 n=1 Tax=Zeugodacus cucurbitae TaxID=28588 RepID=A0A0A1WV25_ZEUCU
MDEKSQNMSSSSSQKRTLSQKKNRSYGISKQACTEDRVDSLTTTLFEIQSAAKEEEEKRLKKELEKEAVRKEDDDDEEEEEEDMDEPLTAEAKAEWDDYRKCLIRLNEILIEFL